MAHGPAVPAEASHFDVEKNASRYENREPHGCFLTGPQNPWYSECNAEKEKPWFFAPQF